MRTTLTLEPDVAEAVERLVEERHTTMKSIVNEALRLGLAELSKPRRRKRFRTRTVRLGARVSNVDDVVDALAAAEGDDFS